MPLPVAGAPGRSPRAEARVLACGDVCTPAAAWPEAGSAGREAETTPGCRAADKAESRSFPPYNRRAPTNFALYQELPRLEILTTSPVWGEWMNWPPPM
jgi:hypothetical protein